MNAHINGKMLAVNFLKGLTFHFYHSMLSSDKNTVMVYNIATTSTYTLSKYLAYASVNMHLSTCICPSSKTFQAKIYKTTTFIYLHLNQKVGQIPGS